MSNKRFWWVTSSLVLLAVFIRIYSASASRVESSYSTGIYPVFTSFLRILFGWLPFSSGDIFYGLLIGWLLWKFIKSVIALFRRRVTKQSFLRGTKKFVLLILSLYVVFNLFWGINYNRQGIAQQINLTIDTVIYNDLKQITFLLAEKLNSTKKYLVDNKVTYPSNSQLFKKTAAAYSKAKDSLPFLAYNHLSIKTSLWGWLGNYTGFTGYYNPFTGEAQVNTTVPKFLQPFIACHEAAHQIGYAKENEANAVGYLAAIYSGDSLLLYSTYFDLYIYASRGLFFQSYLNKDTAVMQEVRSKLSIEVKADIKELYEFYRRHKNPVEPLIREGYAFYLRNNKQPKGIKSYDEVIGFIVAYYKKYGRI